jgi:hypothetical protein
MTLQDELNIEPTEADEAAFFAGVDKVVNEIRELAEKHEVKMENTRDCNICIIRDCPDRPRLGKPVIFNCPNFKGKEDRMMTQEEWEAHSDDWRQGWIDYVQGNDEDMTKEEKAQKLDEWKAGARYACLHPTFPVAVPM